MSGLMKKTAGIAAGVVVALGAVGAAGAWYTGTQLPNALQGAIEEANRNSQEALLGTGIVTSLELVSLETRLFSSTAHYRVSFDAPAYRKAPAKMEFLLVDEIQHGPFPASRLKQFNIWPVMTASHYQLQPNEFTRKWFEAAKGTAPLTGQTSLGYDGSATGQLVFTPLDFAPTSTSSVRFSGLTLDIEASRNAAEVLVSGGMQSLMINAEDGGNNAVQVELRDLSVHSDQHRGSGDFYLGDSNLKMAAARFKVGDKPAVLLKDLSQSGNLQEVGGALEGRIGYDIGTVSYGSKDLAGIHMLWSLKNFDATAVQSLIELYREKLTAVQQAQALGENAPVAMTSADEERLKVDIGQLLGAKPRIALEEFSIKTRKGEAKLSVSLDLNEPESFELPPPELARQMIARLDARLSVGKGIIGDGVRAQAMLAGESDPKAIEEQATLFTEMGSGIALGTGLLTLEGENLQSSLHYADDVVTFNGQDMTVEEFVMFAMSRASGMDGGMAGHELPEGDYEEGYDPDA